MTADVCVVYRGPFQSRRIRLILDMLELLGCSMTFFWLDPKKGANPTPEFFDDFLQARSSLVGGAHLRGDAKALPGAVRQIRQASRRPAMSVAIGFSALGPATMLRGERLVWCINGIPEERLLHRDDRMSRVLAHAMWSGAALTPTPDVVLTVSDPMSSLVAQRLRNVATVVLPTAVDRTEFRPTPLSEEPLLTYVGSGAPWQNLPYLGDVWSQIARLRSDVRFRVVSKDPRAEIALQGLPGGRGEMVAGATPAHVAELTSGSWLGFLLRRPHIVNEVSYPTKFGEHVASGTGVVATDVGWDVAGMIERTGCGRLVAHDAPPGDVAGGVVELLDPASTGELVRGCEAAAAALDRDVCLAVAADQLRSALGQWPATRWDCSGLPRRKRACHRQRLLS